MYTTRNQPSEPLELGLARIKQSARMRFGMICGLIVVALIQTLTDRNSQSFEMIVRGLTPVLLIAVVAFVAITWLARRDERRLRASYGRYLRR